MTPPDNPVLENGNKLCKEETIANLIVWKSEAIAVVCLELTVAERHVERLELHVRPAAINPTTLVRPTSSSIIKSLLVTSIPVPSCQAVWRR